MSNDNFTYYSLLYCFLKMEALAEIATFVLYKKCNDLGGKLKKLSTVHLSFQ